MQAPRGSGFRKELVERVNRQKEREGEGQRGRMEERIVESNIRRTFTVRFPNLYCVWQRCRDIRGSYRNVLLLIVLHPEGSWRPRTKGSGVPNEDGKPGKRNNSRRRETEDSYIGRIEKETRMGEERRGGAERRYIREREKKRERA